MVFPTTLFDSLMCMEVCTQEVGEACCSLGHPILHAFSILNYKSFLPFKYMVFIIYLDVIYLDL